MNLEAVPPFDEAAEMCVLGSMIIEPRAAEIAIEELTGEDFYLPRHRTIYRVLCEMFAKRPELDEPLLVAELRQRNILEEVGGKETVGRIIDKTPTAANIEGYTQAVRKLAEQRALWELAHNLVGDMEQRRDADEVLARIADATDKIHARRLNLNGEPADLHEIAKPVAEDALTGDTRDYWGLRCGVGGDVVDDLTGGVQANQYWVLASRTSMGKSTFATALARGVYRCQPKAGQPLIISTEMEPAAIARAALAAEAGLCPETLLRRKLGSGQRDDVARVIERRRLAGVRVCFLASPTIAQVRALAARHKRRFGLPLLVVDLAGKLRAPGQSEYERLCCISSGLAALKAELQTCILACVQVSRAAMMNADKRPDLKDLKGSGSWEEDADRVLFLHRPAYYGGRDLRTEIIQAKDRVTGNVRSAFIRYDRATGQFVKADERDETEEQAA